MNFRCPVCLDKKYKILQNNKCGLVWQCQHCLFGFLKERATEKKLKSIYQEHYFDDKKSTQYQGDAQHKFTFIEKYLPKNAKILDFGCGLGDFISICLKKNRQVYGYDISSYAARFAAKKYKIKVLSKNASLGLFPVNYFDAIVCFDVIEHLTNFKDIISYFYRWLKPNGYLFITTPNISSWDAQLLGNKWYGFSKKRQHINFFSEKSIKIIFRQLKFNIILVKQWGFVRSIDFIVNKIKSQSIKRHISSICRLLKIENKNIFFPMIDIFIIGQKNPSSDSYNATYLTGRNLGYKKEMGEGKTGG